MKKISFYVICAFSIMLVLGACNRAGASGTPTLHLGDTNFAQTVITIQKGQSIQLLDDSPQIHTISNGSWIDGEQHPNAEPGAPIVNDLQVNGNGNATLGPFNKDGTFHFYCTVHANMNLTVTVTN